MSDNGWIIVNYAVLQESATSLGVIRKEFAETTDKTNGLLEHLGNREMIDAMSEFSTNWKRKRDDLIIKITEAENAITKVVTSFSEQDLQCAKLYKPAQVTVQNMTAKEIAK
jgi:hypothetical protein